eukprot:3407580-Pyramimonas_sp.AAC.2
MECVEKDPVCRYTHTHTRKWLLGRVFRALYARDVEVTGEEASTVHARTQLLLRGLQWQYNGLGFTAEYRGQHTQSNNHVRAHHDIQHRLGLPQDCPFRVKIDIEGIKSGGQHNRHPRMIINRAMR